MAEEARLIKATGEVQLTADATYSSGQCVCLPDGRAAVRAGLDSIVSGDPMALMTEGRFRLLKTASIVLIEGQEVFWDVSANTATHSGIRGTGGDFFAGVCVADAAAGDATVLVDLNVPQNAQIKQGDQRWETGATNGLGVAFNGSEATLAFDAVAEAAMAAYYSANTLPISATRGPIFEADFAIYDIGDNAALDISVGMANGTHATDFDSVTEAAIFHLDGNSLNILAESDDGTTEVAATDTTVDAVDNTYVHLVIDARDPTDIQYYIDGVNVLAGTTFKLDAATGPLLPIVHIEKTSDNTTADVRVKNMVLRQGITP